MFPLVARRTASTVLFLEQLFLQDPRASVLCLPWGRGVGEVWCSPMSTYGHFHCPVSTSCFPRCFRCAVRRAHCTIQPSAAPPLHPCRPRPLAGPAPPRLTLKASPSPYFRKAYMSTPAPAKITQGGYIWPTDTLGLVCTLLLKKILFLKLVASVTIKRLVCRQRQGSEDGPS